MASEAETAGRLDAAAVRLFQERLPRRGRPLTARERMVEWFVVLLVAIGSLLVALLAEQRPWSFVDVAPLVLAFALLSRVAFTAGSGETMPTQLAFVPLLFAAPLAAVPALVALGMILGRLSHYLSGIQHPERIVVSLGDAAYALGPVIVLSAAGTGRADLADWPWYLLALAAQFGFDVGFSVMRGWLIEGVRPSLQARVLAWITLVDLCLAPVGLAAALAAEQTEGAALLVLPLAGVLVLFAHERRARLEQAVVLSQAYRGTAVLLGDLIENDDAYTGEHTQGVVQLTVSLADAVGADDQVRMEAEFAALLHDVGKIAIPNEIINKPGKLNEEEWAIMRTHTIEGEKLLARVGGVLADVGRVVRSSHERWDGAGYPDGLKEREIPYAARMVAICDAYSAMTTDRSYRRSMGHDRAVEELQRCAGTQFDPDLIRAFVRMIDPNALR